MKSGGGSVSSATPSWFSSTCFLVFHWPCGCQLSKIVVVKGCCLKSTCLIGRAEHRHYIYLHWLFLNIQPEQLNIRSSSLLVVKLGE